MSGAAPPDQQGLHKGSVSVELVWVQYAEGVSFSRGLCGPPDKQGLQGAHLSGPALPVCGKELSHSLAACPCGLRCPLTSAKSRDSVFLGFSIPKTKLSSGK